MVLSLTVERGIGMERQDLRWRRCTHEVYEFRPFSEEVIALRLGARRRSIGLYVLYYKGCEPLCQRRGAAYIECTRTLAPLHYKGTNVHKVSALLVTPTFSALNAHED